MSRVRTNFITNRFANGAPTVSNGLIISGVTTTTTLDMNGDLDVDGHTNLDNVSIAGVATVTGALTVPNGGTSSNRISVGDSEDLKLYHDGHSYIDDTGSGNLYIQSNHVNIDGGGTQMANFYQGGAVELFFNNSSILSTASYGIAVNGDILFQDGLVHIGDTNTKVRFPQNDTVSIETAGSERFRVTSTGRIEQSNNNEDIDMDSSANGQLKLDGNGYNAGIALNAQGLNIYHNSSARDIIFGTNETERLRIKTTGAIGIPTATTVSTAGTIGIGHSGQVISSRGTYGPAVWTGGTQRVLEVVASPCDGSVISTSHGNVQFQNVSGPQDLTTSYQNVNGSLISYWPPEGTKQVIYEMSMMAINHDDAHSISHFRFYIDGNEVVYHRRNAAGEDFENFINFKYIINVGFPENYNHGRLASWTTYRELKMTAREYHGSNNAVSLHETDYWDGAGTNMFSQPVLTITAIGC